MTKVKVLIKWYVKKLENGWIASSTTCLITTKNKKIITDPWCNRKKLLSALKKEKLKTCDIDYVFLSHCHPDHILLAWIFEKAKFVTFDSNLMYKKDKLTEFDSHILWEDIEIVETPGHVLEHLSLLVNTKKWKIAIAWDVIWWMTWEKQIIDINRIDPSNAKWMNMTDLIESRKKLLKIADYIIPGHWKMFKVGKTKIKY